MGLVCALELSGLAASISPRTPQPHKSSTVRENLHARRRMRSLAHNRAPQSHYARTRRRSYERFHTSSFAPDVTEGDAKGDLYEYLLSKLTIDRIMTRKVVTVTEDTPLEEAARIMADNNFSGLPVMRGKELVGMITETNIFRIFLEMLGARRAGIRATISMPDTPGGLARLTTAIHEAGGNFISLGTFMGESPSEGVVTFKVEGVKMEQLKKAIQPLVKKIIDIRVTKAA